MTLSRCGRVYPTFDEAYKAAEQKTFKTGKAWKVGSCSFGEHWHVVYPGSVLLPRKVYRPDPFPPLIAKLIDGRDYCCQGCGYSGRLERHHRRLKASGGSGARAHTQCTCNGVSLCRQCHQFVHEHPALARTFGLIVVQAFKYPRLIEVTRYGLGQIRFPYADWEDHEPEPFWPTCDGQWVHSPLETEN